MLYSHTKIVQNCTGRISKSHEHLIKLSGIQKEQALWLCGQRNETAKPWEDEWSLFTVLNLVFRD